LSRVRPDETREGSTLHVLLVEDDENHAALVERGLSGSDDRVRIVTVRDGEEALAYLLRRGRWAEPEASPRPGLVLLDLRLPRLDGFGVLRTLKQSSRLRSIPVVVLTTTEARSEIERAYALRANSYLVKPVDFDRLGELMGAVAAFWLEWNRAAKEPEPDRP